MGFFSVSRQYNDFKLLASFSYSATQCGNLIILLTLRFYVKLVNLIVHNIEVLKLYKICHSAFKKYKRIMKNQHLQYITQLWFHVKSQWQKNYAISTHSTISTCIFRTIISLNHQEGKYHKNKIFKIGYFLSFSGFKQPEVAKSTYRYQNSTQLIESFL